VDALGAFADTVAHTLAARGNRADAKRSGRCPKHTSRWRPSSVSLSAWQPIKAGTWA
jgi:hypothetical protein